MNDAEFQHELEVFRIDVESGIQFLYAYHGVNTAAGHNDLVSELLNKAPLFWNTNVGALQTAAIIALGRVFDKDKRSHNVDKLLSIAKENCEQLFSKAAFGRRKQAANVDPPEWLKCYLKSVYEPTSEDFCRLQSCVSKWREIYNNNYCDIRNKLFAHTEVTDSAGIDKLFAKTDIPELQRMFDFLSSLHGALSQFFNNGQKPLLRPQNDSLHERIMHQAEQFLVGLVSVPSNVIRS